MTEFLTIHEVNYLRQDRQVINEYFRIALRAAFEALGIEWDKSKVEKEKDENEIRHYIITGANRILAHTIFLNNNGEMLINPDIQEKMGKEKMNAFLDTVENLYHPTA